MRKLVLFVVLLSVSFSGYSQAKVDLEKVTPGRFDQGKMWTFENPPVEYFKEAYNFDATDEWMDDARKSALRFASWCSASFISENGLILTNHHCSRGVVASVMKEGENFDKNGYYAVTQADERRAPNLYVDQLEKVADVTEEVLAMTTISPDSALQVIIANLEGQPDWQGLYFESRTFYSGGKYSIYGFKRYNDIRLVLYPELALGYFGGDPDNFTYPRYNLDFTLWRAYDESGQPLKPVNFFEFKEEGADEDELVFIIGNPGSTGRYLTMAQLYYQRDISAPAILSYLGNRMEILMTAADGISDVYKKDSVVNLAFGLSNSYKAYQGRLEGLHDPYLMTKKEKKEEMARSNVSLEGIDPWSELEKQYQVYGKYYAETLLINAGSIRGKITTLLFQLVDYQKALEEDNKENIEKVQSEIENTLKNFDPSLERALFTVLLEELDEHSQLGYMSEILVGQTPVATATEVFSTSLLLTDQEKFFKLNAKKLDKEPLIGIANILVPANKEAVSIRAEISKATKQYEEQIMNLQFELSGLSSPPDATFSLRIADGVVKGYEYNGTTAPYFTTYYGLYNRHYSHNQKYPWDLPEKWLNPPAELLKAPLNFVCTADIIGGNSGSPVINANQEVVGLVFDGNIESLPGYFIYDNTYNRTVSVHSGGIAAALRYIYKADRILSELE